MIQDCGRAWRPQARGPGDAHGLAVLLVAALLAVGTMLPQFGGSGPGFPPHPGTEVGGQPPARVAGIGAEVDGRASGRRPASIRAPTKPSLVGPLDLNTADTEALQALPGVGPTLAERIVADRDAHGPFRAPEDLLRVPGIGPKRWERIRPLVRATEGP